MAQFVQMNSIGVEFNGLLVVGEALIVRPDFLIDLSRIPVNVDVVNIPSGGR